MTVSSSASLSGPYAANGATRDWPFTFKALAENELVLLVDDGAGNITEVTSASFVVTDLGVDAGGTVTYPVAPAAALAAPQLVTIERRVPYVQPTVVGNQGAYYPRVHETAWDRIVMMVQQVLSLATASLRAPTADGAIDMALPAIAARAGKFMAFDSDGRPTVGGATTIEGAVSRSGDVMTGPLRFNRLANTVNQRNVELGLYSTGFYVTLLNDDLTLNSDIAGFLTSGDFWLAHSLQVDEDLGVLGDFGVGGASEFGGLSTFLGGAALSGAAPLDVGKWTTGTRPAGTAGRIGYNTSLGAFEGYGSAWGSLGGGATGGGADKVFMENDQTVNNSYTITTGKNAISAGPITIASGVTVTVPSGSTWVVV